LARYEELAMLRSTLSAVFLAGVFAMAQPAFADPVAATGANQVQAAAAETEQPVPAASVVGDKNAIPVGFGWG
jgi:hypothetical protein